MRVFCSGPNLLTGACNQPQAIKRIHVHVQVAGSLGGLGAYASLARGEVTKPGN